jgi:hypothetical protein
MVDAASRTEALAALIFGLQLELREVRAEIDAIRFSRPQKRKVPWCGWIPTKQASHRAGVSDQAVRDWASKGLVEAKMFDGVWYFIPSSLEAHIRKRDAKRPTLALVS